ncbi:MAG: hypothetical protein ACRD1T_03810 [Acidimicrobiia bacterium]
MSIQQEPTLSTNLSVARVLMYIQGGIYVALTGLGILAFYAFRNRMPQRSGGQIPSAGQFGSRALLFTLVVVVLGALIIFLAIKIGRFSYGALIGALAIEGVITALALFRLVRNVELIPIIQLAFPAFAFVFLITGLPSFPRAGGGPEVPVEETVE